MKNDKYKIQTKIIQTFLGQWKTSYKLQHNKTSSCVNDRRLISLHSERSKGYHFIVHDILWYYTNQVQLFI